MKSFMLSTGGLGKTTLVLMLLWTAACENDDEPLNRVFTADAGPDLNVITNQSVPLQAAYSHFSELSFSWQVLSKPDNSQATLTDADKPNALFLADVPGKYDLELKVANGSSTKIDLLTITAFSVKELTGSYTNMFVANGVVRRLVTFKNKLYAIGDFTMIDGITANHIASFDGDKWAPLDESYHQFSASYFFGFIGDVVEYKDELFLSGIFSNFDSPESQDIASWDGNGWNSLELRTKSPGEEYYNRYGAMAVFQGQLYIGGHFSEPWDDYALVRWDGEKLTGVDVEIDQITDLVVFKGNLIASGSYLASFDGTSWNRLQITDQLNPGFNTEKTIFGQMAVHQDKLYLTLEGWSQPFGWGYDTSELAAWDGEKVIDYGKPFSLYGGNLIYNLQTIGDQVFIAGSFDKVVGSSSRGLVTWDGQDWGVTPNSSFSTNYVYSSFQDQLYTAGTFGVDDANPYRIVLWRQ